MKREIIRVSWASALFPKFGYVGNSDMKSH
jgi:hypothetical protein